MADIRPVDLNEGVAVGARLLMPEPQRVHQLVDHDVAHVPVEDVDDLRAPLHANGGAVEDRVLDVQVVVRCKVGDWVENEVRRDGRDLIHGRTHQELVRRRDVCVELVSDGEIAVAEGRPDVRRESRFLFPEVDREEDVPLVEHVALGDVIGPGPRPVAFPLRRGGHSEEGDRADYESSAFQSFAFEE